LPNNAINSSFGVVSIPDIKTVQTFAFEEQNLNLVAKSVESHFENIDSVVDMLSRGLSRYRYASDFESLIYFSEITQGAAIKDLVNKIRLERKKHLGVIYSSLNESTPCISSSTVDYFGRKKAVYYLCRSFLRPTSLILKPNGQSVEFYISNETRHPYVGTLKIILEDASNNTVLEKDVVLSASVAACDLVHTEDFSDIINGNPSDYYVSASINDGRVQNAAEIAYFVPPKHFGYLDPEFNVQILGSGRSFELVISAKAHAALVAISFTDIDATLENNYFNITKGAAQRIPFTTSESFAAETLLRHIVIKSLYEKSAEI
jgi:beta-mannosidase